MQHIQPTPVRPSAGGWFGENDRLAELVSAARAGSVDAFEEFYLRTARWLLSHVRRLVGEDDAEDVLAEVYIQVWRSLDRYDTARAAPAVWLAMIARSRALDHLRREKRHGGAAAHGLQDADSCPDPADGPEQLLSRAQERSLLQLSLAGAALSAQERLALGLAYFRECTQQEVATLLGLPLGTARALLCRAQDKLRLHLLAADPPLLGAARSAAGGRGAPR